MSDNAAKVTAAGRATTIAVPAGVKPPSRAKLYSKLASIGLLAVVVLVGLGLLVRIAIDSPTKKKQTVVTSKPESNAQKAAKITTYDQAVQAGISGNSSAAQLALDNQLSAANTPQEKAAIYNQKSNIALNAEQYDEAISYGLQSDKIVPMESTANMLYQAYLSKGDKADAKIWLQKAIDRLNKQSDIYQREYDDMQTKMTELNK